MSHASVELLTALRDLRQSITAEAALRIERWQPDIGQPAFAARASNLAHYLAFRHHDLRELQRELMRHGLSSLGEMTDAAIAGRAECVMLNKGPNVGGAVIALSGLLHHMVEHQSKKTSRLRALRSW